MSVPRVRTTAAKARPSRLGHADPAAPAVRQVQPLFFCLQKAAENLIDK